MFPNLELHDCIQTVILKSFCHKLNKVEHQKSITEMNYSFLWLFNKTEHAGILHGYKLKAWLHSKYFVLQSQQITNKSCECMSFVQDDCFFKQIINFCAFFIPIKKTQKINCRKDLQYGISIIFGILVFMITAFHCRY